MTVTYWRQFAEVITMTCQRKPANDDGFVAVTSGGCCAGRRLAWVWVGMSKSVGCS